LLLAGARKAPFPAWANTQTRPLDPHFGAGEVNLWRSHRILVSGEVAPNAASPVSHSGWHFEGSVSPGGERFYRLRIPDGCVASELSAALVWNRTVPTSLPSLWLNPTPQLANLDLRLEAAPGSTATTEIARSESGAAGSAAHPLEHVYVRQLATGDYRLRVVNAPDSHESGYALAWFMALAPAAVPEVDVQWSPDAVSLTLALARLGVGLTYALQSSDDLISWHTRQTLVTQETSATLTVTGIPARAFYRLVWVP
jgi:hypothetical protein